MLRQAVEEHSIETATADVPAASFIEWLAEWARDARRRQNGLLLLTAHRAKGLSSTMSSCWTEAGTASAEARTPTPRGACTTWP